MCEGEVPLLFTENETNTQRLFNKPNPGLYVKDGINNFVVDGRQDAVNPYRTGTKAAAHYQLHLGGGETKILRLRLGTGRRRRAGREVAGDIRQEFRSGRWPTDCAKPTQFYAAITPAVDRER